MSDYRVEKIGKILFLSARFHLQRRYCSCPAPPGDEPISARLERANARRAWQASRKEKP